MALGERENRIQAGLFEAGGVKQCQVEAGADLAGENVARAANHLARTFEAPGRQHIGDRM
jgi:hypothetical protein